MSVIVKSSSFLMKSKIFKVNFSTTHGKMLAHTIWIFKPNKCLYLHIKSLDVLSVSDRLAALSCAQNPQSFLVFHRNCRS